MSAIYRLDGQAASLLTTFSVAALVDRLWIKCLTSLVSGSVWITGKGSEWASDARLYVRIDDI